MNVAPQNEEIAMEKLEHTFHILIKKVHRYWPSRVDHVHL